MIHSATKCLQYLVYNKLPGYICKCRQCFRLPGTFSWNFSITITDINVKIHMNVNSFRVSWGFNIFVKLHKSVMAFWVESFSVKLHKAVMAFTLTYGVHSDGRTLGPKSSPLQLRPRWLSAHFCSLWPCWRRRRRRRRQSIHWASLSQSPKVNT